MTIKIKLAPFICHKTDKTGILIFNNEKLAILIWDNKDRTDNFSSATKQIKLAFFIFNNKKLAILICDIKNKTVNFDLQQ